MRTRRMLRLALVILAIVPRHADAGPWCGGDAGWAPVTRSLPPHGHLAFYRQQKTHESPLPKIPIHATIGGKRVELVVKDVHVGGYLLQLVEVKSSRTGPLELSLDDRRIVVDDEESTHGVAHQAATFTIARGWKPAVLVATTARYHRMASAMMTRWYDGLAVTVDGPAIAFHVRWRRDDKDGWHELVLPALDLEGVATMQVGQTECGADTIPLHLLEQGVTMEVGAVRPDGTTQSLDLPPVVRLPPV